MLDRGDWITPTLGGFNWFEKPVLLYWLEIVSYKLFGVNEFAARFGPALFGLGTIASLWILGRSAERTTNNEPRTTNGFANWLALIAASTLGILCFARAASFDIIITFPITAALVSFLFWHRSRGGNRYRRVSAFPRLRVSGFLLRLYGRCPDRKGFDRDRVSLLRSSRFTTVVASAAEPSIFLQLDLGNPAVGRYRRGLVFADV